MSDFSNYELFYLRTDLDSLTYSPPIDSQENLEEGSMVYIHGTISTQTL